jgi:hypothetical protein
MTKIKVAREIEFIVNITYKTLEDKIEQTYSFNVLNKKYLSYAFDYRFTLKRKLDKLYQDKLLNNFLKRIDCPDKVIFYYSLQAVPKPEMVNETFYLPPFNGCLYCKKASFEDNEFVFCKEKNKHMAYPGVKSCKIFNSIEEVLT